MKTSNVSNYQNMEKDGLQSIDVRLHSPFTSMITGPTGSGKTQLVKRLIEQSQLISTPPPIEIIYCYGIWQEAFEDMKGVEFHEGLKDPSTFPKDGENRWMIIDDLMEELSSNIKMANNLYTRESHHLNISIFTITQNLFFGKLRTISLNSHYFFIGKNPRDSTSITFLGKQVFPGQVKYFQESYRDATSSPYSFMRLDLRQETDDTMRIMGNFPPVDSTPMIIYKPN